MTFEDLLTQFALFKQRYTRGTSWTQILLNFGIITANAKLFEDFFYYTFGLTLIEVIILSVPVYVSLCYAIGRVDERIGFWQIENNLSYRFSPLSEEMLRDVKKTRQDVTDMKEWMKLIIVQLGIKKGVKRP